MKNFVRLAAAVPELRVGGVTFNCDAILRLYRDAAENGAAVVLFPELAVTGCSCGDLFLQKKLLDAAENGLQKLASAVGDTVMIVGVPLVRNGRLFNCAAVLQNGKIRGLAAKSVLTGARSSDERRHFRPASEAPFDALTLFQAGDLQFGVEIGGDLFSVKPPSADLALAGAQVIFNPSGIFAAPGQGDRIRETVRSHSSRLCGGYVFCGAGVHESTTDGVYAGQAVMAIHGGISAENQAFTRTGSVIYSDFNCSWVEQKRRKDPFFMESDLSVEALAILPTDLDPVPASPDLGCFPVERRPFVPADPAQCRAYCAEIAQIQTAALAKRIDHTRMKWVVGLSGGLDSTLALLAAVNCRNTLGLPMDSVQAVGMPGFGTSGRTKGNAEKLAEILSVPYRTIPIGDAVAGHFRDIGHDPALQDVVYENSQARERTQILMDVANGCGGLVLGTGDLSEIALGWCTYNGDHMSMYSINGSIPKTLVRDMVAYYAETMPETRAVLQDILDTPVSPELLPGKQHTEELIGSYELHDFFLYYFMEYGADPETLLDLAATAFPELSREQVSPVLQKFLGRFFSQQFKRNAMPDGARAAILSLSPRGDWQMPSDAVMDEWMDFIRKQ